MRRVKASGRRPEDAEELETTALYVPPQNFGADGAVELPEEELHHLCHVLRRGEGSLVQVLDGCGGDYQVRLERRAGALAGRVERSEQTPLPEPLLSVALAPGRKERWRIAVEKLAELGCHRIIPLVSAHVSFPGDPARLAERMQAVCVSALKQSRRPFLTRIEPPVGFDRLRETLAADTVTPVYCLKKTQQRAPTGRNRIGGARECCLVVGPEGGFDRRECEEILLSGAPCLDLGPSTLRFETAALAGFVILRQLLWADQGLY